MAMGTVMAVMSSFDARNEGDERGRAGGIDGELHVG